VIAIDIVDLARRQRYALVALKHFILDRLVVHADARSAHVFSDC
jgi:hypothetical protein